MNSNFCLVFTSILLEEMPFMLVGSIAGGLMEEFVSRERMLSILPKRPWMSAALAALAGIILPVCECAVVPIVKRLAGKGLPPQACVAYLLAAPIVNPIVAASTALAYRMDLRVVAVRMVLGYVIALGVGLLVGRFFKTSTPFLAIPADAEEHFNCACGHCHAHDEEEHTHDEAAEPHSPIARRLARSLRHAATDFIAIGPYLMLGALIAALATTYIDRRSFLVLGDWPFAGSALMIALAFLLNLCSQADAFVAASFNGLVPLSSQMAFMLIGPILDLKLLLMYRTLFRKRAIILIALSSLILVAVATAILSFFDGGSI